MKQQLVPAISDSNGSLAINDEGAVEFKPHGHGDVHTLLHTTGTAKKFQEMGKKWLLFFQDTNGLVFHSVPGLLGVSVEHSFEVNSLCIPRRPGEAVGGLMQLNHNDGRVLTINVEYNQIDALLRDTISPDGDVPDDTGFSPYPGSINVLMFALDPYIATLDRTGGTMPEFVNPKYTDSTCTKFKKPTRLECMMQEYPKLLDASAKVGFTTMERWVSFSAVKNNLVDAAIKLKKTGAAESAASGENDHYEFFRKLMLKAGAKVASDARICFKPNAGVTIAELEKRFGAGVEISSGSTLVIDGDITLESLKLDGTMILTASPGASVLVRDLEVKNEGWTTKPTTVNSHPHHLIRGYEPVKIESYLETINNTGKYILSSVDGHNVLRKA